MGHLPSGKVAANDNSLATAQASVAGTIEEDVDPPPAKTATQGAKILVSVDVDADDLTSMDDSLYNPSSSSSSSSPSSKDYPPNSASTAPPEDIETEHPEAEPNPVAEDVTILNSTTAPLQSVGDQQQTLGDAPRSSNYSIH